MKVKKVLITGSNGLIGGESVKFFGNLRFDVYGIDNNMRAYFFGPEGDTNCNKKLLQTQYKNYHAYAFDIRDEKKLRSLFKKIKFDLIIHTAAQPSHDWSAREPLTDFTVNALATIQLLEMYRKYCPEAVFIFTSTNKVYGSNPNLLPFVELETRWELPASHSFYKGINESMSLDNTVHSLFGVSKTAADLLVQEYGKYFGLRTTVFRCGCLTGPMHSAAKLHGFLAYLIKSIREGKEYTIIGYKGKQVRDNIHSIDLVKAFYEVYKRPRKGEVYNMGGSRHSNISVLEAIRKVETVLDKKATIQYSSKPRIGDHIWYVSDVSKFRSHYPRWNYTYTIDTIISDMCFNQEFRR